MGSDNRKLIKRKRELETELVETCRTDPAAFQSYAFGMPLCPMHLEWLQAIEENDFIFIAAPRGHGKSSVITLHWVSWKIGNNPDLRVKVATCSSDKGSEIGQWHLTNFEQNEKYHKIFPNIRPGDPWTSNKLTVQRDQFLKDATLEVNGITSSVTGGRCDVLIADDVVDRRNSCTAGLRKSIRRSWDDTWMKMTDPRWNKVIYIGTPWFEDDLTMHIWRESKRFKKFVYIIDEDFTPLWPEIWPREALIAEFEEDEESANRAYRLIPYGEPQSTVTKDMLMDEFDPLTISNVVDFTKDFPKYTGVDPAISRDKAWTVVFTIAVDENGIRIPIDIKRLRQGSPNQGRVIIDTYEQFKSEIILVESNTYQKALLEWTSEMKKLPLKAYFTTGKSKWDPQLGLASMFMEMANRMWRVPKFKHSVECQCGWCGFMNEVLYWPNTKYKDCVLASFFAREAVRSLDSLAERGRISVWAI